MCQCANVPQSGAFGSNVLIIRLLLVSQFYYLLFTFYYLLFTIYYLLFTIYILHFAFILTSVFCLLYSVRLRRMYSVFNDLNTTLNRKSTSPTQQK